LALASAACLLLSGLAAAQHTLFILGAGSQQNQSGSAAPVSATMLTLNNSTNFPGAISHVSGLAITQFDDLALTLPIGNLRADIGTGADVSFGVRFLSAGAGAQYRIMLHRFNDPSVLGGTEVSMMRALGIEGVSKAVWGPHGNGYVQFKYAYYPAKTISNSNVVQDYEAQNGLPVSSSEPTPLAGHDVSGSVGYFIGPFVTRVQYLNRRFAFASTDPNAPGTLLQRTRQLSFGFGLKF
jgi:hypothetical protein